MQLNVTEENVNNKNNKKLVNKVKRITYDDILHNMNMYVVDGKLYLNNQQINNQTNQQTNQTNQTNHTNQQINTNHTNQQINQQINQQNSYIYNKYFKDEIREPIKRQPKTLLEYRNMLIEARLEKERIKQIKSKKMIFY